MPKTLYPRPTSQSTAAAARDDSAYPGEPVTVDPATLIAAGIDPDTISSGSRRKASEPDLADQIEAEIVRDVLADDLDRSEALAFASCFWTGTHRKNVERARSTWRVVVFMTRHPNCGWNDIPPALLDTSFFRSYSMPRKSVSSLVHWWMHNGSFARAEAKLNALPIQKWDEHRRQQMAIIVEWEKQVQARTDAKRKQRLVKNARKGAKS